MSVTFFKERTKRQVLCRGMRYGITHISLEECQACEHHGGYKEIKPAQNNLPPVEVIICKVPVSIRVSYFVEGIKDKGKEPIREGKGA